MSFSAGAADERVQDVALSDDALSVCATERALIHRAAGLVFALAQCHAGPAQELKDRRRRLRHPLARGRRRPQHRRAATRASAGAIGVTRVPRPREQLVVGLIVDGLSNKGDRQPVADF